MDKVVEKNEMKNRVIQNYPNSEYAQLLINPNMLADQEQKLVYDDRVYEEIFFVFKKAQYEKVITDVNAYKNNVKRSELRAKFDLIHAFAKGNLLGKDTLEFYLRKVQTQNSDMHIVPYRVLISFARFNMKYLRQEQRSGYVFEPKKGNGG